MSRSLSFQLDRAAFCSLAKVGPRNVMFFDMIRGQYDRLLCSVQKTKTKNEKKGKETNKRERTIKIQLRKI